MESLVCAEKSETKEEFLKLWLQLHPFFRDLCIQAGDVLGNVLKIPKNPFWKKAAS